MRYAPFLMLALLLDACGGGSGQISLPTQRLPESFSATNVNATVANPAFATYAPAPAFTRTGYPGSLAADGAGNIWYSSTSAFERRSATSTTVVGIGVPVSHVSLANMVRATDGNVYVLGGYGQVSFMIRLTPAGTRTVLQIHGLLHHPYVQKQLMAGSDGYLYAFVEDTAVNNTAYDILKISTVGNVVSQHQVLPGPDQFATVTLENSTLDPTSNSILAAIYVNGNPWTIYRYDITGHLMAKYSVLNQSLNTGVDGMVIGPDGNLWLATIQHSCNIVRLNLSTRAQTCFTAPSLHGNLGNIAVGNDGAMWFGDLDHAIGRVTTAGAITTYNRPSGSLLYVAVPPKNATAHTPNAVWFADDFRGNYTITSATY